MANTIPPSFSRRPDSDEFVLTDRELVSRYIRYSESLDEETHSPEMPCAEPTFSSPASDASNHDGDTSHISAVSNSTTQTTPLRNDLLAMARHRASFTPLQEFEAVLNAAELPTSVKDDCRQRGREIMQISSLLFFRDRNGRVARTDSKELITALIIATGDHIATAINEVEIQVQNTAYIQTLGPFTISGGPDDIWPIYKQMMELVLEQAQCHTPKCSIYLMTFRHTKPPSRVLVRVMESLAYVWDAYVYQPTLVNPCADSGIELQLHALYDAIMSLLMKHQEWCRATELMTKNHLRPTLQRILSTPAAVQCMDECEAAKKAVNDVLDDPENPGYLPVSAEGLQVLREKRSTQLLQIRAKRKYARVYTV